MQRKARWERAVRETHGLKDWRRGVATALIAGCCSIVALGLFGLGAEQLTEALVIAGSVVGAYVLRPVAELIWNYLWGPWRLLREEVTAIAAQQRAPAENASPEEKRRRFQALRSRLKLLRELEDELRKLHKSAVKALESGYGLFSWQHPVWDELKNEVAGIQDMQTLYEELRDCIDELDDLLMYGVGRPTLTDDGRERLQKGVPILERALGGLGKEIKRLRGIK